MSRKASVNKVRLEIRLPPSLAKRIRLAAFRSGRSVNATINLLLAGAYDGAAPGPAVKPNGKS